MASSNVNVALNAVDNVTPALEGITARGTIMGNVITGGLQQIGNLAGRVFGSMRDQYQSAADTQMSFIGTAGSLMTVLNQSYDEALDTTMRLNDQFVELGAQLPGTAEDFSFIGQSISDDLFNAFRDANGAIDMTAAEDTLMNLTEKWGLFAQQTQTATSQASQNLVRLMSGDVNVLRMVQFDKSPAFKNALDRVLEADQKTRDDWEDATTRQRAEWIEQAVSMTIPPEAVEAMSGTISGTINQWRSSLFDATSGVFGFLRDIEGRGTIMEALEGIIQSANDMVNTIVQLWPFKGDVLAPLYDALRWIQSQIDGAVNILNPGDVVLGLEDGSRQLSEAIGQSLRRAAMRATIGIRDVSQVLSDIDFTAVFSGIVNRVTQGMENLGIDMGQVNLGSVTQALAGYMSDFQTLSHSVGSSIINGLLALFNHLVNAVAGMQFDTSIISGANFGAMIGRVVGRNISWLLARTIDLISDIDYGAVRRATLNVLMGVGGAFIGLVVGLTQGFMSGLPDVLSSVLGGMGAAKSMVDGIMDGFFNAMVGAVMWIDGIARPIEAWAARADASIADFAASADAAISGAVVATVEGVTAFASGLKDVPKTLVAAIKSAADQVQSAMSGLAAPILSAVRGIFSGITTAISNVGNRVTSLIPGVGGSSSNNTGVLSSNTATTTTTTPASSQGDTTQAPASSPSLSEESEALRTQHSASGNLVPLLQSIRSERRLMPAGSNLVVANSSETILNRKQTRTLASNITAGATRNTVATNSTTSPTINATFNISGTSDPDSVARLVLQRLDNMWASV